MHYRWSFPENYLLFEADAGNALLPGFPRFAKNRLAAYVASTLRGYLPSVGVVPAQFAVMERWTENMLDALDRHFAILPFLLGSRSEEHTSELQSLMRISYAVFCLKKQTNKN